MEQEALQVLQRLVTDDDQSVEAWYLGGWCLYIVGEKLKEAKGATNGESEEWQSLWKSARKWLSLCLKLYEVQDYEDARLGDHAVELRDNITKAIGEPQEGEEEESEDGSDEEDENEDEEMVG